MAAVTPRASRGARLPAAPAPQVVELTVVIPCLNEAETLGACIEEAREGIFRAGVVGEIVVADNGSTDGSREIAGTLGARVVDAAERGYGNALRAGIEAARGRYVVIGDADASYDFSHLDGFVARFREGYDVVMGNRFRGGIRPGAMPWLNRWIGNPVLSAIGRLFFGAPVGDFHCGLRGLTADAYRRLRLNAAGMEFASEMVVKATVHRLRVTEVPVALRPDGRSRAPHLRRWRDGWRHLRFMLLFSPRWLFLYPGVGLMVAGAALSAWLLPGGRTVGRLGLDVDTLLVAGTAVLVGYQLVTFAVFSKVYAVQAGFHPPNPTLTRLFRHVRLETGLLVGALMSTAGFMALAVAAWQWQTAGFGTLDPERSLRIVIPAAVLLAGGVETIFASFFLSILGIEITPRPGPATATG